MDVLKQEILNIGNELAQFSIQRYEELPDIDLYMEQVVGYVNKHLETFNRSGDAPITPSMINNYVKYGIIPPPDKKKYKRRHIAYIYVVYFLKQVLTMSQIKAIIRQQVKINDERIAYEFFCTELERAIKSCCGMVQAESTELKANDYALKYSAVAIANKLYAQKIIELVKEPEDEQNVSEEQRVENKQDKKADKKAEKIKTKQESKVIDKQSKEKQEKRKSDKKNKGQKTTQEAQ